MFRLGSTVIALRQLMLYQSFIMYLSQSTCLTENQMENVAHINQLTTNSNALSQADNTGLPVGFKIYAKAKISTEYGSGSFTLIICVSHIPSKSTTLISILNALHLWQYQKYYLQSQQKHCHRIKRIYTLRLWRNSTIKKSKLSDSKSVATNSSSMTDLLKKMAQSIIQVLFELELVLYPTL